MLTGRVLAALTLASLAGCAASTPEVDTGVKKSVSPGSVDEARAARASAGAFHDILAPYGRWAEKRKLGWVWAPDAKWVGSEFFPYVAGGGWVPTDQGWMFVSEKPWGVTFHYGRWLYDAFHGWIWRPGRNWAPAWVAWMRAGEHVGWAPLPPRWHEKVPLVASHVVFVRRKDLERPIATSLLRRAELARVAKSAKLATDTVRAGKVRWYRGPAVDGVSKPVAVVPPQRGQLVRARVGGGKIKLEHRGAVELRRPVRSGHRPAWKDPYRGPTPAAPIEVKPAMPPLPIDEEGRRWR